MLLKCPPHRTSKKGKVIPMEKSIAEMRSAIVRYYEEKGYTHAHAEDHVPHDASHVLWLYNKIQEEKDNSPQDPNE